MSTQHTPGPWMVTGGARMKFIEARIGGGMLQEVATCLICQEGDIEANARLIAAAPDLLAECEREYTELADIYNNWPGRNTAKGQMKMCRLRDLIAAATGRSHGIHRAHADRRHDVTGGFLQSAA